MEATDTTVYERTFAIDASPETVWEFLVDPEKLVGLAPRGSRIGISASFQLVSGLQEIQSPSNRADRKVKLLLT